MNNTSLTFRTKNASLIFFFTSAFVAYQNERTKIYSNVDRSTMNAKQQLQYYAQRIAKENFSAYEFAKEFNVDYSNVCKFYRDAEKMPIKIALETIDNLNGKLVVFRNI